MSRGLLYFLAVFALSQLVFGNAESSHSLAKEWQFRVKPRGTIKVVDLYIPSISAMMNYAEGLVILDKENNHVPGLAEDWRWIDDKTIEFRLRLGVKFHNDEEFNAETVRLNWTKYRQMEGPTPHGFLNLPKETTLEIVDKYTVRFCLPQPDGLLLTKLLVFNQFAPAFFKRNQFDEMNWGYLAQAGPWGTGPFEFVEGNLGYGRTSERLVLEAHDTYWDRRYPRVKQVIFENSLIGNRKEAMW